TDGRDPYAVFCGTAPVARDADTVTPGELAAARADGLDPLVLDVREEWAARITPVPGARLVPSGRFAGSGADAVVRELAAWAGGPRATRGPGAGLVPSGRFAGSGAAAGVREVAAWAAGRQVHVLCRAGVRSARVAGVLREAGVAALSVEGGVAALRTE